jgi:hypothetical protein
MRRKQKNGEAERDSLARSLEAPLAADPGSQLATGDLSEYRL